MKDIITVLKKELRNVLKDRRTLFMLFGVPVIMFLLIFNVMGEAMKSQEKKLEETVYKVYTNHAAFVENVFRDGMTKIELVDGTDSIENDLRDKRFDLAVVVEGQMDRLSDLFKDETEISIYSFSGSMASERIARVFSSSVNMIRDQQLRLFLTEAELDAGLLDKPVIKSINIATEKEQAGATFGGLLPYLLVIYLFTASFSVGFDVTAGEKERQTLTILLANRVSRSSIAWGKILYLMLMNILSAAISVVAFLFGFSSMIPQTGSMFTIFTPGSAALLFLIVISLAVLIAAFITVIGIFARSVKEASAYSLPIYVVTILFGILGLQSELFQSQGVIRYIPLINGIFTMKDLITQPRLDYVTVAITVVINLAAAALLAFLAAKMFSDERFVFRTGN